MYSQELTETKSSPNVEITADNELRAKDCSSNGMTNVTETDNNNQIHNDIGDIEDSTIPREQQNAVFYHVDEKPPLVLAIFLGFQHFLTFIGSGIGIPILIAGKLCMSQDPLAVSQLISTAFFVEGIVTFMQVTFGVRLPVVQGGSAAFLAPTFAILQSHGECTVTIDVNSTKEDIAQYTEAWQNRIQEIQGAIMVASCLQIFIGFTGLVGVLLRYIGPVTIAPVVSLVGLGILGPAADRASKHWGVAFLTIILIVVFSQYMGNVSLPRIKLGKCRMTRRVKIFKMLPIVLATTLVWLASLLVTSIGGVFPDSPSAYGYEARTDLKANVLREASWFRIPYPDIFEMVKHQNKPSTCLVQLLCGTIRWSTVGWMLIPSFVCFVGQWGVPYVTIAGVLGMFSAVIASVVESIGDYYATAKMAGAPPPPVHAVNRGIFTEGLGCLLAGAWGTANGTTTFSQNAGLVGLTKVGSRFVIQICALIMILFGICGKIPAFFSSIPIPIVGGMLCVLFGTVLGVGLSNLQYIDLSSPRNVFIVGFSLFIGILIPNWVGSNRDMITTGIAELDQVITVLLTTGMFIGGMFAFVLDNTIPGTLKERGIISFRHNNVVVGNRENASPIEVYELPIAMELLRKWSWTRWIPVSPTFKAKMLIDLGSVQIDD